jgi:SAM-dependent methyltransferase
MPDRPSLGDTTYVVRAPLARWLREEGRLRQGARVLDVGCGEKPYRELFDASEYVGVDAAENAAADLHGRAEELPVPDASFDVVLCLQVLEHVEEPARAVRELHRATAPGGRVLAATHGVQVYHPNPDDLWRWTHAGLQRLFAENGDWSSLDVRPGAGTAACLAMLLGTYVHLLAKRAGRASAARPLVALLNRAGLALDRRVALLREPGPGTLFANYHVTAVK